MSSDGRGGFGFGFGFVVALDAAAAVVGNQLVFDPCFSRSGSRPRMVSYSDSSDRAATARRGDAAGEPSPRSDRNRPPAFSSPEASSPPPPTSFRRVVNLRTDASKLAIVLVVRFEFLVTSRSVAAISASKLAIFCRSSLALTSPSRS